MEHIKLIRDSSQNHKNYQLPAAQLAICDISYRLSGKAYRFEVSKRFFVEACESMEKSISIDMFSMTESKYYQRQQSMATQTTLDI